MSRRLLGWLEKSMKPVCHGRPSENHTFTDQVRHAFSQSMCRFTPSNNMEAMTYSEEELEDLPKSFDARKKWKNCRSIGAISDQGVCGSCWAFGSTEAMADRICIHSQGKIRVNLSAIHVTSCFNQEDGCQGIDSLEDPYTFYQNKGIVTGGSYKNHEPKCKSKCQKGYPIPFKKDLHFGKKPYQVKGEKNIMKEIMKNGPVTAGFTVYSDFVSYSHGVYKPKDDATTNNGGHAIKILGWGEEKGKKYWLIANSWDETWGDKGFVKFIRGINSCKIESSVYASMPNLKK
ncbi:Pept-C1 domain-containing protein [Aphelenchoides bicaudatus]|nr:Pept-C1 domain-containing protein [Aphelenchoides bicaudatus]